MKTHCNIRKANVKAQEECMHTPLKMTAAAYLSWSVNALDCSRLCWLLVRMLLLLLRLMLTL